MSSSAETPARRSARELPRGQELFDEQLAAIYRRVDRLFVYLGVPYPDQVWVFRICFFVLPVVAFLVTRRLCGELAAERRDESASAPG